MKKPTYLEALDRWLDEQVDKFYESIMDDQQYLGDPGGFEAFTKAIKAKIVESYRNGQRSDRQRKTTPSAATKRAE